MPGMTVWDDVTRPRALRNMVTRGKLLGGEVPKGHDLPRPRGLGAERP